jgi:CDP-diacylglycerol--glycerol-3-phosphate 3-phosphatidyltransferase
VTGSFVSDDLRQRVRGLAIPVAISLGRIGLTPNALTVIGFAGTCLAGLAAAGQQWALAGGLVLAFGMFDLFDGALARATGRASKFGAFLDSTLDRTGEGIVLAGVAYGAASAGFDFGAGLAALALACASAVTYVRAKAESLGVRGDIGIAPRPERLVVLALGLAVAGLSGGVGEFDCGPLFCVNTYWLDGNAPLAIALGLIALLSAITVVQRIIHVRRQLDRK